MIMGKIIVRFVLVISILCFIACGGVRFSQLDPEAIAYHPKQIAVFPADVGSYEEARDPIEQIVPNELTATKWFDSIIDTAALNQQMQADVELRQAMTDYLSKLKTLNYSDPALSGKIGQLTKTDAFLLATVDQWNYTVVKDKNLAKASIGLKLIDAETGKIMWKAGHNMTESYVLLKPELSKVARSVVRVLVKKMPH